MAVRGPRHPSEEFVRLGTKYYEENVAPTLKPEDQDCFVAIDIESGDFAIHRDDYTATELPDAEKPALLRAYLKRWKFEVGMFFDGVGPDATDDQLLAIAPGYPVFRITEQP